MNRQHDPLQQVLHAAEAVLAARESQMLTAGERDALEHAVAIAFLKKRGCVVPVHGRRHAAASPAVCEDAMIEYRAPAEHA